MGFIIWDNTKVTKNDIKVNIKDLIKGDVFELYNEKKFIATGMPIPVHDTWGIECEVIDA